ncbi:MAG: hypothetical protein LBB52_01225, partial [Desulfovibrio sp.]|nr:hypothetical protein [Desulfovibrio sp.]
PAATLAICLGLTGPCATVCQWDNPVAPALATAEQWLREGRAKRVLFGAADECTTFLEETSARLSARKAARASGAHPRVPLGEGAVFFCLEDREKGRFYGEIGRVELGVDPADSAPQTGFFVSGRVPPEWGALPGVIRALPAYGNIPIAQALDLAVFFAQADTFPGGKTACVHFGRDGLADIVRAAGKSGDRAGPGI